MNKIVREHYPVEMLPSDLRVEVGAARTVRLVIEADGPASGAARGDALAMLSEHRKTLLPTAADSVSRVSRLRDEWDD